MIDMNVTSRGPNALVEGAGWRASLAEMDGGDDRLVGSMLGQAV